MVGGAQFSPGVGDTAPLRRVQAGPPPGGGPQRRPQSRRLIQGAGLLAVAVVSGLIWTLVRQEDPTSPVAGGQTQPAGEFTFTAAEGPVAATDCAANSYGETKRWFAGHPCQRLSRALYVVTSGGARALVSVALVTMPTPQLAVDLKALTDTDDTGNVNDLIRDNTAKIPDAPKISGGQYDSRVSGSEVTIVEAEFFQGHQDDALLQRISAEALQLNNRLR
ncbi:hypothetical protein [Amycolatopsis nigrescens]|uniref:hypothetical protein n=1 Tax=Amycolatopsis nigrescens TaxID=381445 RepID=UPI00037921CE